MKNWLCSLAVAFSMYSKIPMPRVEWTKERMEYAMCFFPLIGLVVGAAYWLFGTACGALGLGETVFYAGAGTLIPLAVTGGIHMDGYLDTCDALCSYGSREKRLEILKDPHTGAFAVIRCGMYLLGFAAVFSLLPPERLGMAAGIFTLSRALSGFAVVSFPKAKPPFRKMPPRGKFRSVLWSGGFWPWGSFSGRRGQRCAWPAGWPRGRRSGDTAPWLFGNLAASPAIWPGIFCSGRSCGSWPLPRL